ncbi:MAG: hypothetical protein C3F07_13005 [Anaerolineales bacterium]|nr:MAG: hypothetical protein C3F07_13005 [Anaerolineales bacterium]
MNQSRLIWGLICLGIAAGLIVLNLTLPEEDLIFQIGDINMPWVPPVALGILGIILLTTAGQNEETKMKDEAKKVTNIDPEKAALNKRLETMAWGAFLIMLGGFLFVSEEIIRGGWWSIGVGLILLGLNGARYTNGLRMSGFTTFLGVVSVFGGILDLVVTTQDFGGAILLIILGGYLILKPWFDKRQLFGKAEKS